MTDDKGALIEKATFAMHNRQEIAVINTKLEKK
jgi:hypothetical protein